MKTHHYCLWLIAVLLMMPCKGSAAPDAKSLEEMIVVRKPHVTVAFASENLSVQPGRSFWVAVHFRLDEGWHTYWKNPGDSGLATEIALTLPERFKQSALQWPAPEIISRPPLTTYGYEKEVFHLFEIESPADLVPGTRVKIGAKINWLECQVNCFPGKAQMELELPVLAEMPKPDPVWAERIKTARQKLPVESEVWKVSAEEEPEMFTLNITSTQDNLQPFQQLYFFPEDSEAVSHSGLQPWTFTENGYEIKIPKSKIKKHLTVLKGILAADGAWVEDKPNHALSVQAGLKKDSPVQIFAEPVQHGEVVSDFLPEAAETFHQPVLLIALLFAFAGGLILNLMPCVLPVLGLKILSLIEHSGQSRAKALRGGCLFTLGVLVSFWALAGAMLLIRLSGEQIGWGFQLQSPWVVLFLIGLFLFFAFNLFGFFEVGLSLTRLEEGTHHPFWGGVFATVVATPCTAPFMGAALGYTLTQPVPAVFLIFTALGLGMAFPYLIFSIFPGWLRVLPKPGAWMLVLKKVLGLLMLASALWLGWVLSLQMGWIAPKPFAEHHGPSWQAYDAKQVEAARAEGKPVFIDFTAAWCLSCQVNDRLVFQSAPVIHKMEQAGVTAFKADWTNKDEKIASALASYGRNSIPLYVFYPADSEQAVILPELLTADMFIRVLDQYTESDEDRGIINAIDD